ncbi:MAG TPA: hypothetical protein VFU02_23625 [Polyangiaceae bacterium]|nr:hypothetical protein [Polyangiaceae bacterium]
MHTSESLHLVESSARQARPEALADALVHVEPMGAENDAEKHPTRRLLALSKGVGCHLERVA